MERKFRANKRVKAMRFRYRNTFKGAARWPETIVKHRDRRVDTVYSVSERG